MVKIIATLQQLSAAVLRFFLPEAMAINPHAPVDSVLAQARERTITSLLRVCAVFGILPVALGSVTAWINQSWLTILIGNGALLTIMVLAINRQIHYRLRAAVLVAVTYLYLVAWSVIAPDDLLLTASYAFVIATTLLLGRRIGLGAFVLTLLNVYWLNWRITFDGAPYRSIMPSLSSPGWLIAQFYIELAFYLILVLFTLMIFLDDFHIAWQRERAAAREAQQERDRLADALAREQRLMQEVSAAYEREAAVSQLKSRIIQTVSHEFRTPLTVVQNSVDLLTKYNDRLEAEQKERIQNRIQDSIFYLTTLLRDISIVNRESSQEIETNPIAISANRLLTQLQADLHVDAHQLDRLHFAMDQTAFTHHPKLLIDTRILSQITSHLVHNALNFSPPDSSVQVYLSLVNPSADSLALKLTVSDQGIGIPPTDLPLIYDLFYRGSNTVDQRGLGLGLFVVKRLVEIADGSITVKNNFPAGTRFVVSIPLFTCPPTDERDLLPVDTPSILA